MLLLPYVVFDENNEKISDVARKLRLHPSFHGSLTSDPGDELSDHDDDDDDDGNTKDNNEKKSTARPVVNKKSTNDVGLGWGYKYQADSKDATSKESFSTRDIISWSFQIARGMDYIASKKVIYIESSIKTYCTNCLVISKMSILGMNSIRFCTEI